MKGGLLKNALTFSHSRLREEEQSALTEGDSLEDEAKQASGILDEILVT